MLLLSIVADGTSLSSDITTQHTLDYQSPRSSTIYPQIMADRTRDDGGVEDGQFFTL